MSKKLGEMNLFPITVFDNFYDNPEEVIKYAESLEYHKDPEGSFPGSRTLPLHMLNEELNHLSSVRFLSLFFDLNVSLVNALVLTQFQKIEPFSEDKNSILNEGWIHVDDAVLAAAVVYLSPDADPSCGTSFYKLKPDVNFTDIDLDTNTRRKFYKTGVVSENYYDVLKKYNSNFVETVSVKNYCNRIVAYDSNVYHKATTHFNNNKPRLTQTFFLYRLKTESEPLVNRLKFLPTKK